LPRQGGR